MWKWVLEAFSDSPAKLAVARKMIENGLCLNKDGKVCCGDIEIKEISLAKACGVDRRVVSATIKRILADERLSVIFLKIRPAGAMLKDIAQEFGFGVVELEADAKRPAIIANATRFLGNAGISIRQIYAKDPDLFENPTLIIIAEKRIPGNLLNSFRRIPGVRKVSIL
ncbi:MAG: hypothetical protein QXW70_03650 [Candidatus Anstonellales archaeon]